LEGEVVGVGVVGVEGEVVTDTLVEGFVLEALPLDIEASHQF
jgi:hypothetical protein